MHHKTRDCTQNEMSNFVDIYSNRFW